MIGKMLKIENKKPTIEFILGRVSVGGYMIKKYKKLLDNMNLKKKMTGVWLASVIIILIFGWFGT